MRRTRFSCPLGALLVVLLASPASAQPQAYASGLVVTLPEGWDGAAAVDESGLPGRAAYRFENTSAASALFGAVVHVERVAGLNPVMRQRWMQGRVPHGYHGARPVAPLPAAPLPGAVGFRTERAGPGGLHAGHVYFLAHGGVYWAVQVEAPAAVFDAHEALLSAFVGSLRLGETAGDS